MRQMSQGETIASVVAQPHLATDPRIKVMLPVYQWLKDNPQTVPNPQPWGSLGADGIPVAQSFEQPDKRAQYRVQIVMWYDGLYFVAHGATLEQATEQMVLKLTLGDGQPPLVDKPIAQQQERLL